MTLLAALVVACTDPGKGSDSTPTGTEDSRTTPPDDSGTPTDTSTTTVDGDGDGYDSAVDCDDADATTHPGAEDAPDDGVDQDCDGIDACVVDNRYPGGIVVGSDEDLAEWVGFCDDYDGAQWLDVSGTTAADLSTFGCLCDLVEIDAKAGGVLLASNPGLESLDGLEHLTSIGYLVIQENPLLTDISAFSHLRSLEDVSISGSPIGSLAPLSGVTSWAGSVSLAEIPAPTVEGLEGMRSLEYLTLNMPEVVDLAPLAGLEEVQWLDVVGFAPPTRLTSLDGLNSLRSGWVTVTRQAEFADFGPLPLLESTSLGLIDNPSLTSVTTPPSLQTLDGLGVVNCGVTSVSANPLSGVIGGDGLYLADNPLLTDLTGLSPSPR